MSIAAMAVDLILEIWFVGFYRKFEKLRSFNYEVQEDTSKLLIGYG
jgi:hypothetical protein